MAKIVKKHDKSDKIMYRISMKEILQTYFQSLLIVLFIALKSVFVLVKNQFDKRFGATRQKLMKPFYVLSSSADKSNGIESNGVRKLDNRSVCPGTQNTDLGEHKYIKVKHIRFHYVEKGEENDRVILLLHGFPDCFFGWRNQIDILSQTYRVIALDLKGFNDSDRPLVRCAYKPERICHEIKEFIDALGIKSVCIVGHDIGALLGWILALKYPDHVNKFFCVSTPYPNLYWYTLRSSKMSKYWFNMIQIPLLPEKELSKDNSFIHETYKHLIEDITSKDINRIVKYKQINAMETYEYIFSRPEDFTGALNYLRNLMFYRVNTSYTIRCPCIFIFGTNSPNFGLDMAIKSAEFCENPLVKIIEGAGYWPHQTHVTEFNAILLKYLIGDREKQVEIDKDLLVSPSGRGLVGRVMDKVYSVGQQYRM